VKLELKVESSNAAFEDDNARAESVRILRRVAELVTEDGEGGNIRDINGNMVGKWTLEIADD
jgi:hypothetical protein